MRPIQPLMHIFMVCFLREVVTAHSNFEDYRLPFGIYVPNRSTQAHNPVTKRGIDRYRFFGLGIGKRGTNSYPTADVYMTNKNTLDGSNKAKIRLLPFLNSLLETDMLQRALTKLVSESNSYEDIIKSEMNKRDPEVYKEAFYPVQAGKQQMEAKIDINLDDRVLDADEEDGIDQKDMPFKHSSILLPNNLDNTGDTSDSGKMNMQIGKRWWAASRFAELQNPKSSRSYRRTRVGLHPDPGLYFLGLGRR